MKRALKDTPAVVIALAVVLLFFIFTGLLPHLALLSSLGGLHFAVLVSLVISTYGALAPFSLSLAIVTVALLFLNSALLVFYIRKKKKMGRVGFAPAGLSGVIASIFGIGCASCGTVIGTSILGIFGASGLLASLPFGGQEFSLVGIIIFILSIRYLLKKVNDPDVCQI